MSVNVHVKFEGLDELASDIQLAAKVAPNEFKKGMRGLSKMFMVELEDRANETYASTEHIASGFQMSPIRFVGDDLIMKFMPEAKGNQGHAWHLHEFGYDLKRPNWKSRRKVIRNEDAGRLIKHMGGNQLVDKMLPAFEDYMEMEVEELVDGILEEYNL